MLAMLRQYKKVLVLLTAVLLLFALGLTLFHHHADAEHASGCLVCHFVHQLALVCIPVVAALVAALHVSGPRLSTGIPLVSSLFFSSACRDRAPPFSF